MMEAITEVKRRFLNVREAAIYLGVKPSTIYHWVCGRKIPFVKLNSKIVRFDIRALDQWAVGRVTSTVKEVQKNGNLQARQDLVV
jgi:excisionase family DNA binding protein